MGAGVDRAAPPRRAGADRAGAVAAAAICCAIRAWEPPFSYRIGHVPMRDIVARVRFTQEDTTATDAARQQARNEVRYVFVQDPKPLEQLRASLYNTVVELTAAATLTKSIKARWREFQPPAAAGAAGPRRSEEQQFQAFRAVLAGPENLARFKQGLADALAPFEQRGLLDLEQAASAAGQGGRPAGAGKPGRDRRASCRAAPAAAEHASEAPPSQVVKVADVLIGDGAAIHRSLQEHLASEEVADRVFAWLRPRLPATLKQDEAATQLARDEAAKAVPPVVLTFETGQKGQPLAAAGQPLDAKKIELLKLEYDAFLAQRPLARRLASAAAMFFMVFGLLILCGVYMRYRQRGPLASLGRLTVILLLALATVLLARWAADDAWRAELAPLLLFGMTMAIVYRQELALLLSGVLAWVVTLAVGHGLPEFLLLFGAITAAVLNLGHIRSRSKLIYVGLSAGGVAFVLNVVAEGDRQPAPRPRRC